MNYKNLTNECTELRLRKMNYKNLTNWYTELRHRKEDGLQEPGQLVYRAQA
jgi:hypothetical protein